MTVDYDGRAIPVDTGFIVFNRPNYPNLSGLFAHLGVPTHASDMTFAASIRDGWLEWGLKDLDSVLGQRRNLLRPRFGFLVRDVLKFNAMAQDTVERHPELSVTGPDRQAGPGRLVSPLLSAAHVGRDLELSALRDDEFPGAHPGAVFRQPSSAVLHRPAAMAHRHRRIAGICPPPDRALRPSHPHQLRAPWR